MHLTNMTFSEFDGGDREWTIDNLSLSDVNLIVGRNATGKSRTLNVIHFLSTLFSGERKEIFSAGHYKNATFQDAHNKWEYALEFDDYVVTRESLVYNGDEVLQRGRGSYGRILANDIAGGPVKIRFSVPDAQIALAAKKDDLQHPYMKPLHDWAHSVRYFKFGTEMSPNVLAIKVKDANISINEKDTQAFVPIYAKAKKALGDPYIKAIIADMALLGYDITDIDVRQPQNLVTNIPIVSELVGISVRQQDLRCYVDQLSMSQGMFRSLSIIAQVNYYIMSGKASCFLVDDIGDGLDFERSCILVDILRTRVGGSGCQLIMTTNNRFVMNRVPLEEWSILERKGHVVRALNYRNSAPLFDRFKITGLSNFELLATDFLETAAKDG